MMIDKLVLHSPLCRQHQHQHLRDAGMPVSRKRLTRFMQRAIMLLEPIHDTQTASRRTLRILVMDETPINAGSTVTGSMREAYFWPVYGQRDEIFFPSFLSRSASPIQDAPGLSLPQDALLQTDGYAAYAKYARKIVLTHAQCWSHPCRKNFDAKDIEPGSAGKALVQIGVLVAVKAHILEHHLTGIAKLFWQITHVKSVVQGI
ncbi:MAG: transposase [Bradyrhizobium sp.]|jgi:transposase